MRYNCVAVLVAVISAAASTVHAGTIVVGRGADTPQVAVFDAATGSETSSFLAYAPEFTGGVRVASGDVNGDGIPDVITGAGPGGSPHVKVFDGATGAVIRSFFAFDVAFTGGVFVAAGDVNGDAKADLFVGADASGGPHVKVFDAETGTEVFSFFAYDAAFTGGVRVASGDVNGDGVADIATGAGPGGGPHVKVFDGSNGAEIRSFFAFAPAFGGGVFVAAGDVTGDAKADVIVGADAGGSPHVKAFDATTSAEVRSFLAYDVGFAGGVRVAAADVNGDGVADIITGPGEGGAPAVKIFDGTTNDVTGFLGAPETFLGGIYVAADRFTQPAADTLVKLIDAVTGVFHQSVHLLENAQRQLEAGHLGAACNMIGAFINQVQAQSGKSLPAEQADAFIQSATHIRSMLGCP